MDQLKKLHPEWYQATDYHWLDNVKKPDPPDHKLWNMLDDIYRRDMASWSCPEDFFGLPYGEY